jgi:tetratricopeptide (TPR) repeat protein
MMWRQGRLRFLFSILVIPLVSLAPHPLSAAPISVEPQGAPAHDPVETAIDHLRNLEYDAAREQLQARLSQHPSDLRGVNYLASTILQREMFHRELLESRVYASGGDVFRGGKPPVSPAFRAELFAVLAKAESLASERLKQNPQDESALYWIGVTHTTRAIFHVAVARENTAALGEAKAARKFHQQLLALNPSFVDAMLVVGIYDYVVGSLPWYLKVLASITGHRGDRVRGLLALERVTREGHWAKNEAKQFLAILYFRERRFPEALAVLQELSRSYPRNFVLPQEIARVFKAQGNWAEAAQVYDQMLGRHQGQEPGYHALPVTKILFQAGEAHARNGDMERALSLYDKAARLEDNNIFVYRAELAAAGVYLQQNRPEEAQRRLERVARAVPQTNEGKAARQQLRRLRETGRVSHGS